jgi:2-polyprenyl-3-methyl-5-hydroxy-6-metoxy-1,4-benzoquinol methylase
MAKERKNAFKEYDEMIDWYNEHRSKDFVFEKSYVNFIQNHIPLKGNVLDVGCGTGIPWGKFFIEQGYVYTGVDASQKMIALCQKTYPKGRWLLEDMRHLNINETFDLVIAWHSLFHLPIEEQSHALESLGALVNPKGLLVFTTGPERGEEWVVNGGRSLYQASLSLEEYEQLLIANDFQILIQNVRDPECGGATVWVASK